MVKGQREESGEKDCISPNFVNQLSKSWILSIFNRIYHMEDTKATKTQGKVLLGVKEL